MFANLSQKSIEEYKERLSKTKKLNRESQTFIKELFEEIQDENSYRSTNVFKKNALLKLNALDHASFEDLFPANIHGALQAMLGEQRYADFIQISKEITRYPYTVGYYRKPIRSNDYKYHFEKLYAIFEELIRLFILDIDVMKMLKREYDTKSIYNLHLPELVATQINQGNQEVIEYIKEMICSDNNHAILDYHTLKAVFMSENKELLELVKNLLLAAKLQEGLRQSICETMDSGTFSNFCEMFHLVYEHDLLRFSAVKRALGTWTGIGESYGDRIGKKEIAIIKKLIDEPEYANTLLKSKDNVELFLGLWAKGNHEVKEALDAMKHIVKTGEKHNRLLASYYLDFTGDKKEAKEVSKEMILSYPNDLEILACFNGSLFFSHSYYVNSFIDKVRSLEKEKDKKAFEAFKAQYFSKKEEGLRLFDLYEEHLLSMKNKEAIFDPCIFPWNQESISKENIVSSMFTLCALLNDTALKDRLTKHLKYADSYRKTDMIRLLYAKPENKLQKDFIISALSDRNSDSNALFKIVKENDLFFDYKSEIEHLLRLKTQEIRQNAINMLYEQEDKALASTIEALLAQKDEQKRLGALDMLTLAKKDGRFDEKKISAFLKDLKTPSTSEEVLINVLLGKKEATDITQLDFDPEYEALFNLDFQKGKLSAAMKKWHDQNIKDANKKASTQVKTVQIHNHLELKKIFAKSTNELIKITKELSKLIEKHAEYEYKDVYGSELLIGDRINSTVKSDEGTYYKPVLEQLPLADVWEEFYHKHIKNFETLFQYVTLYDMPVSGYDYEYEAPFSNTLNEIFGFDLYAFAKQIEKEDIKYSMRQVPTIMGALFRTHKKEHQDYLFDVGLSLLSLFYQKFDESMIAKSSRSYHQDTTGVSIFSEAQLASDIRVYLNSPANEEQLTQAFALKFMMEKRLEQSAQKQELKVEHYFISFYEIIKAVQIDLVASDLFYQKAFQSPRNYTVSISNAIYGPLYRYEAPKKDDFIENEQSKAFAKEHGSKIIDYFIDLELRRGDSPTPYSEAIYAVRKVYGIDRFIAILLALGKETLDRGSYYSSGSKKVNLSHLLKISEPLEGETVETLKKKLKGKNITDKRLIETSMYAPKWIDLLQEYLGWKGMASGCYYFQAHTSDIDKKLEGLFATFTPISIERLQDGAFDLDWFKSAYKELGEDHFNMLYDAAKYISDGAKHSRARMFADATLGRLDLKETEEKILDKRNQNLVMSYSLIPLAKKKDEDILRRYKFLQQFLKDSKQFGAQRRASEAKAVEISLENLSRNAGYSDVTRLTCAMETALIYEWEQYFKPYAVGELEAFIEIDEAGKSEIIYQKDGKRLKSLPAKHKKNEYILKLKEVHKNLKDQYTRARKLFETSMEDGVEFFAGEISDMMENPVIRPILKTLVFKSKEHFGFFEQSQLIGVKELSHNVQEEHSDTKKKAKKKEKVKDEQLQDKQGFVLNEGVKLKKNDSLKIAHALDFYQAGSELWAMYQGYLFQEQIKQAFKQVFRELYVKTKDELGKENSLRYAGNQVQPAKTVALLKGRRWMIDSEEGLQKVYYKENIIAKIYALADWFSPADIEAPTLEWVCFYDRKDHKPLKIDTIPDLIFSEVMRDVDLAVSVAHVGGVDPETSHSTIEMRKAIFALNLKLFKLDNVSFSDNYALIKGKLGEYSVHLGSGVVHKKAGSTIHVLPVHSQHRGKIFLPFVDEDPKTAEIMSKILLFAEDEKIKDPFITEQFM